MAATNGQVFVFGGSDGVNVLGDLLCFNPVDLSWSDITSTALGPAPKARHSHGFAIAPATSGSAGNWVYMYGGIDASRVPLGDLVGFDPVARRWNVMPQALNAPPPRYWHGFTAVGGRLYVHGGATGKSLCTSDFLAYDLASASWIDLSGAPGAPSGRAQHAFAAAGGKLYVHGGQCAGTNVAAQYLGDFYVYDISNHSWTSLNLGKTVSPRQNHAFVSDGVRLFMHGGSAFYLGSTTGGAFDEFFVLDPQMRPVQWARLYAPIDIHWPTTASSGLNCMVGDGSGRFFVSLEDWGSHFRLFLLDMRLLTWEEVIATGEVPPTQSSHAMAFAGDGRLYVHGANPSEGMVNDLFAFDPATRAWRNLSNATSGTRPSARNRHGFAAVGERLFIYGGYGKIGGYSSALDDLYFLNVTDLSWTMVTREDVRGNWPEPWYLMNFVAGDAGKIYMVHGAYFGLPVYVLDTRADPMTWDEISSAIIGTPDLSMENRFAAAAAWVNRCLVVAGGFNGFKYVTDSYIFCPDSMVRTDLSIGVSGPAPNFQYAKGGGFNGHFYMFSEYSGFFSLAVPRDVSWSHGAIDLAPMYDWDRLVLPDNFPALLASPIRLCIAPLPCSLSLYSGAGSEASRAVRRAVGGSLSCQSSTGCTAITVTGVRFECEAAAARHPVVAVQGTALAITNTSFVGCSSLADGAAVQVYDGAQARVEGSTFVGGHTWGRGGAVACLRSTMTVRTSRFANTSAALGGGCVWAVAQNRDFLIEDSASSVTLESVAFDGCSTDGNGGAILASGEDSSASVQAVTVRASATRFVGCRALGDGGALSVEGNYSTLLMDSSELTGCVAGGSGGAVHADMSGVGVASTSFTGNVAEGVGGGALSLTRARFLAFDTPMESNTALSGGGGALWWKGWVLPLATLGMCPPGTISAPSLRPCSPQQDGAATCAAATCLACEAGTYQDGSSPTACLACDVGSFSGRAAPSCEACGAGSYSVTPRATDVSACVACAAGWYSAADVSTRCLLCNAGRYTSLRAGSTECVRCVAGTFSNATAATTADACIGCAPGSYADSGNTVCMLCDAGSFTSQAAAPLCDWCPSGEVDVSCRKGLPVNGNATTLACYQGQFSSSRGVSACTMCAVGTYSGYDGATKCSKCPSNPTEACAGSLRRAPFLPGPHAPAVAPTWFHHAQQTRMGSNSLNESVSLPLVYPSPGIPPPAFDSVALRGDQRDVSARNPYPVAGWLTILRRTHVDNRSESPVRYVTDECGGADGGGGGNQAMYGECIASSSVGLDLTLLLGNGSSIGFAGIPFDFQVRARDAHNNTVLSDVVTFVEARAGVGAGLVSSSALTVDGDAVLRLHRGRASGSIAVHPGFRSPLSPSDPAQDVWVQVAGADALSGTLLLSRSAPVPLAGPGGGVCPAGYVLSLDPAASSDGLRRGTCVVCAMGTYSVDPLAGGATATSDPACLKCPLTATCSGGSAVVFSSGRWVVSGGMYVLVECPAGSQLVNTVDGAVSHDVQRCVPCHTDEYILASNSSRFSCQSCPVGATCDGASLRGKVNGSVWDADWARGQYVLASCPAGYQRLNSLSNGDFSHANQECQLCPATYYCAGGATPAAPCPDGSFSAPGSNSSLGCRSAVMVQVAVALGMAVEDFNAAKQATFREAVALTCGVQAQSVVIAGSSSVAMSRRAAAANGTRVDARVATNSDAEAAAVAHNVGEGDRLRNFVGAMLSVTANVLSVTVPRGPGGDGNSQGLVIGLTVGLVGLAAILLAFAFAFFALVHKESAEEKLLRTTMTSLRSRLGITRAQGFVLNTESGESGGVSSWWRCGPWRCGSAEYVVIQRVYLEAAAKLDLFKDFDIGDFNAFCHCLQLRVGLTMTPALSRNQEHTPAYMAMRKWVLALSESLIRPSLDDANAKLGMVDGVDAGKKFGRACTLPPDVRFSYFTKRVCKARVWDDDDGALFEELRRLAGEFMDDIARLCDCRFKQLRTEPGGEELLRYFTTEAEAARLLNVRRQDHKEIRAIVVSDEAFREAYVQRVVRTGSSESLDEEVFIAQLVSRAKLLNPDFQARVAEVVAAHEASPAGWEHLNPQNTGAASQARRPSEDSATLSHALTAPSASAPGRVASAPGRAIALLPEPPSIDPSTWAVTVPTGGVVFTPSPSMAASSSLPYTDSCGAGGSGWAVRVPSATFSEYMGSASASSAPHAAAPHKAFQRIRCAFREGVGTVEVHQAPIKGVGRIREKLAEYLEEQAAWPLCAQVLDPVRTSVVCEGPAHMVEVAGWFIQAGEAVAASESARFRGLPICRVKNKFALGDSQLVGGYRDLMLCGVLEGAAGLRIVGEIQIHDRTLHDLKMLMHKLYRIRRAKSAGVI